jgi:hypothetical protein
MPGQILGTLHFLTPQFDKKQKMFVHKFAKIIAELALVVDYCTT